MMIDDWECEGERKRKRSRRGVVVSKLISYFYLPTTRTTKSKIAQLNSKC
jgi:hypothetical protein